MTSFSFVNSVSLTADVTMALPQAMVLQATGEWEGSDGKWSTFSLQVGSEPSLNFHVLPSISGWQILLPDPTLICKGPNNITDSGCLRSRGAYAFGSLDQSTTWTPEGVRGLQAHPTLFAEDDSLTAEFGLDTIALENVSSLIQVVQEKQVVGGYANDKYWLGLLGLATRQTDLSVDASSEAVFQSPLASLLQNGTIPSLSFGYTAGSYYGKSQPKNGILSGITDRAAGANNFGSLTLGGYDASRRSPQSSQNLEVKIDNQSYDLKVQLLDISVSNGTTGGQRSLLPIGETYSMFLDTSTSQLWLPEAVCDMFVSSFGIEEDSTGLFRINATAHQVLIQNNPSVTFTLGPGDGSDRKLSIEFGYNAFDLKVSAAPNGPYPSNFTYFPIRRAANDSQFVLGRAFFQETYITVDWGRANFTLSKAQPFVEGVPSNPQSIAPPEEPSSGTRALSSSEKVGIGIGSLSIFTLQQDKEDQAIWKEIYILVNARMLL
ncbi:hypothetical protein HII31_01308 [Pseudocercospora fuligena]|uniref:Peptidase A1 domain-containing protein n=1 Tax=Pseudocercospora fuligena TaxID=685502 RepID=A0A8H6RV67_9PEZI|nr:hypothetical protein HII31_01308 [Pseudocercospora fuligena]